MVTGATTACSSAKTVPIPTTAAARPRSPGGRPGRLAQAGAEGRHDLGQPAVLEAAADGEDVLAASASYLPAPAAMRISLPDANPALYLTPALAITFPFNLTFGILRHHALARHVLA